MNKNYRYIFDMDGTLYNFSEKSSINFEQSDFNAGLKQRIIEYMSKMLGLNNDSAIIELDKLSEEFDGQISLGFETKYGINRYEYFKNVWDIKPENYIKKDIVLSGALKSFSGQSVLLSSAPRIWIDKVLSYLNIADVFDNKIYSGEPDLRKPDSRIFSKVISDLNIDSSKVISIGDQNETDILPAKSVGTRTIIIGPDKLDADYRASNIYEAIKILNEDILWVKK